jgi:hypothetical protein
MLVCLSIWLERRAEAVGHLRRPKLVPKKSPSWALLVPHLAGLIGGDDVDRIDRSRCGSGATPTHGGTSMDASARE